MRGDTTSATNAAFIVRAVNAHDALVAALKEAERFFEYFSEGWGHFLDPGTCLAQVRAALALAEEKTS